MLTQEFNLFTNIWYSIQQEFNDHIYILIYLRKYTYAKGKRRCFIAAARESGLERSTDKTKYMVMSRDQSAGRNHSVRIDNSNFERVEEFKYLGTTLRHQNSILFRKKLRAD
jgi:hypothetical protein